MPGNIQTLTITLEEVKRTRTFKDFSHFIIEKMGIELLDEEETIRIEQRKQAFQVFRERTQRQEIASLPTMRRWFGIGGKTSPSREQVYHMCFAMGSSATDVEEFLLYGIQAPAFQVNDYQETILMYGLENNIKYEECLDMINEFEEKIEKGITFNQTGGTQILLSEFKGHVHMSRDRFLDWMIENGGSFKGYSKTTLDYFVKYKKIILSYVKKDAEEELLRLLSETDYDKWCQSKPFLTKDSKQRIHKYLKASSKGTVVSQDIRDNIMELAGLVYTEKNANLLLLSEVYQSNRKDTEKNSLKFSAIDKMTGKHLSDLLNVATQKERMFHVRQARRMVEKLEETERCPEWIQQIAKEYSRKNKSIETVKDAKEWTKMYLEEHKRRCLQIQRSDILPMILYVSQRRYLSEINQNMNHYKQEEALSAFENLSNATLSTCNMCHLSKEYELDNLLRACFGKEEMYLYTELIEVVG